MVHACFIKVCGQVSLERLSPGHATRQILPIDILTLVCWTVRKTHVCLRPQPGLQCQMIKFSRSDSALDNRSHAYDLENDPHTVYQASLPLSASCYIATTRVGAWLPLLHISNTFQNMTDVERRGQPSSNPDMNKERAVILTNGRAHT